MMGKKCQSQECIDGGSNNCCPTPRLNIYEVLGGTQFSFLAKAMYHDLSQGDTEGVSFAPFGHTGIVMFDRKKAEALPFMVDLKQLVEAEAVNYADWRRRETERREEE